RADDLELRRQALDLTSPILNLRGESNLPVALQSLIIGRKEPDHIGLAAQHETPGVRSGEANLLEPRNRRILGVEISHQHSISILWITKDELILGFCQCFDRRAIAVATHQFTRDAG